MKRLSVIIPNYNYAEYVGEAIESALAIDWPDVEVIVVDDGSTDESRKRIEAFGDRVIAIFQENAGAREAVNTGFAIATGEAVLFLDSDDIAEPQLAARVAEVWHDGVSKVQFPLRRVDSRGAPIGSVSPEFAAAPAPDQIRRWMLETASYPTPPGSGNVYARAFLQRIFPLDARCGAFSDSMCLAAAPFLGDVVTVLEPLARYRLHGENDSNLLKDNYRFGRELRIALSRHRYSRHIAGLDEDELAPLFRGRHLLQVRIAARRLRPQDRAIPGDSWWRMLRDTLASPFFPGPESITRRLVVVAWSLLVLTAPGPVARRLIEARFDQGARAARLVLPGRRPRRQDVLAPAKAGGSRGSRLERLSVIIPNYNYEDYIATAIESALSVRWPDVEVIVVDDGSTDGSRQRIESFGDRITAIFRGNAGPRVACNIGFQASTGNVVIFLDSDDVLEPHAAEWIAANWRPGISKLQFPMTRIDRRGVPTGTVFPPFRSAPSPEDVRRWMRTTASYPTPPGSGNAYAREFLEELFPLGDQCGDATDSACLAAAPFLGDVVTVLEPLARYRQHGDNRSHLLADHDRFARQLARAYQRHLFALEIAGDSPARLSPLFRGRHLLQLRVAGRRLRPAEHPIPGDSALRMLGDALVSPFIPGPETLGRRLLVAGWAIVTLIAPRRSARRLIERRFRQHTAPPPAVAAVESVRAAA